MKLLVSACLLGSACRYDGNSKPCNDVILLAQKHTLIPFCPEIYGGLETPRAPSEIVGERVLNNRAIDVTEQYKKGAKEALRIAKLLKCDAAILKKNSPSCGKGKVYDGSFTGTLRDGNGITAELLLSNGFSVFCEDEIDILIAQN